MHAAAAPKIGAMHRRSSYVPASIAAPTSFLYLPGSLGTWIAKMFVLQVLGTQQSMAYRGARCDSIVKDLPPYTVRHACVYIAEYSSTYLGRYLGI